MDVARSRRGPRRVALVSAHTSPLAQAGTGDAGGLNTYVVGLARALAARGDQVDLLTRATAPDQPPVVPVEAGVRVRHVPAGPLREVEKEELPGLVGAMADHLVADAAADGGYDVVHSHYWLSGQVGRRLAAAWHAPLVHSMHTMALVKDLHRGPGQAREPQVRVSGERAVVAASDGLVASTADEARELVELYGADPARVAVVPPGVDLSAFSPSPVEGGERAALGLRPEDRVLLFAGRLQPLKGPDVLLRAAAELLARRPDGALRGSLVVAVVGGPSGRGTGQRAREDLRALAGRLGLAGRAGHRDVVRLLDPQPAPELARWYRAADVVAVPSRTESFGLVALEAQACGTPVVATATGGLRTAVADGRTGLLVEDADPGRWADALGALLDDEPRRRVLGEAASTHAAGFSWAATARRTQEVYARAAAGRGVRGEDRPPVRAACS
ncbi:D-inositol-3-phosphate glycosyltransferase [uncultured Pseudokineococcus sp.]|uniref:D-inositol-3-phosphate glycosyltransferase n=1 Tax=uncultured Pseudokineococcus sp. TaxID=1642928 RepID=UPI00262F4200|nr:D-inositol-3-phosphate glycosyltransferase [uncultured Pseudokineococcus sp.]